MRFRKSLCRNKVALPSVLVAECKRGLKYPANVKEYPVMKRYLLLALLCMLAVVSVACNAAPSAGSTLIEYHRSGGIAGLDERLRDQQ